MNKHLWQMIAGAICIAFAPIFVRLANMGPTESAFYRCFFGFLLLLPVALNQQGWRKLWRAAGSRTLIVAGGIFSLDLFVWHKSVVYSGAGTGTLLANTQVFYLALVGHFFFKEKLTLSYIACTVLAFAGIALLVLHGDRSSEFEHYYLGVALGFATGLIYASYILAMRASEKQLTALGIVSKICLVSFWSAFFLALLALIEGVELSLKRIDWLHALLLALVPQITGWILITRSLPYIDVSLSGLIILMQPVMAFVFAWILLQEHLSLLQVVGVSATVSAIFIGERVRKSSG